MPNLVRAVIGDREVNVSPEYAKAKGLKVLDEPTARPDGRLRPTTRRNGRPAKPKTSVAEAAAKKAAESAEVSPTDPPSKEN